jgi:cobalamin-dependent methionine synthase I
MISRLSALLNTLIGSHSLKCGNFAVNIPSLFFSHVFFFFFFFRLIDGNSRSYPKIFDDETVGAQARKLFQEAQQMLTRIIEQKLLVAKVRNVI